MLKQRETHQVIEGIPENLPDQPESSSGIGSPSTDPCRIAHHPTEQNLLRGSQRQTRTSLTRQSRQNRLKQ